MSQLSSFRRNWLSRILFRNTVAVKSVAAKKIGLESLEDRITPATLWYIDPLNGSDSNAGTQLSPWATLQASLDQSVVVNGDTLSIAPGAMTEQGTPWVQNTDVVSVLIDKSVTIQGTDQAWNPITDVANIQTTISLGSQGYNSQALLVVNAPNVTITGLEFNPINADAANPVDGSGQLIFIDVNNTTLKDLFLNCNRTNADTQMAPGTTATAVYFYDVNPTLNAANEVVSSSISQFLITENKIGGSVVLANATGYGQPSAGMEISRNEITKGLFGAVYLMGNFNDPANTTSIYDVGLPTITGNDLVSNPFATNPTDPANANNGAFQSLYALQSSRPSLSYYGAILATNLINNYVGVQTPDGNVRQQGSALTTFGFNVFPYLFALSSINEYYQDLGESENGPVQAGDTIRVAAPDISTGTLGYNILTANAAILQVDAVDPGTSLFQVTLSEYVAPGATVPFSAAMTFARGAFVLPTAVLEVIGNSANNVLTGDSGDNCFTGGVGNDTIDGVAGTDRARFSGSYSDYSFNYNSSTGVLQVTDNRPGSPDGVDSLTNIDNLEFDNGGSPEVYGIASPGTTIQSLIDATITDAGVTTFAYAGAIIVGNHATDVVNINRDFAVTGVINSVTALPPTALSFELSNGALLAVGSGNITAPTVTVNNGSTISDGVFLTAPNGTLNVEAGSYTSSNDNNVIFIRNINLAMFGAGSQVTAAAFTLQFNTQLLSGWGNFAAPVVVVYPGSLISQGQEMTDMGGTLFLKTGTFNENVTITRDLILASDGGPVTIHGTTATPMVIDYNLGTTTFIQGVFNYTSTITSSPAIEVRPGSYLGLENNAASGTAIIHLVGDATLGGNLEFYGNFVSNNRILMGNNSSTYAYGNSTPTLSGILEFESLAVVTLGAANAIGSGSILTINGPVIDNGVLPTIVAISPNQVIITATLLAVLNTQTLYVLNTLTNTSTTPAIKIYVVVNGVGGVNASTLAGAMTVQLADGSVVPLNVIYTGSVPAGATGLIAEYTITPMIPLWQNGPEGIYEFYITGVEDNVGNTLPKTLITSVLADFTAPTVTVTPGHTDPTNLESTTFDIVFSSAVTGFTRASLVVSGCTITDFTPNVSDASRYSVVVAASGIGERTRLVTVTVPANAGIDAAGNPNSASSGSITFDNVRPVPFLTYVDPGTTPTSSTILVFSVQWTETVNGFTSSDVNVQNGSLIGGSFVQDPVDPTLYIFAVLPLANGPVVVSLVENVAEDNATNPSVASNSITVEYDGVAPTVVLSAVLQPGNITSTNPIYVTMTMSEPVLLRDATLLVVTGGTAGAITMPLGGDGTIYTVAITPLNPGAVTAITVTANAGTFKDLTNNISVTSNTLAFTYQPQVSQGLVWSSSVAQNGQGGNQISVKTAAGVVSTVTVFPGWTGGVRTAVADVTGDGVQDIIAVPTAGGAPNVVVISGATGLAVASFYAFAQGYQGGLTVAAGDLNGNGIADIVVGSGGGASGTVATFSGQTWANLKNFYAYGAGYTGQVNVGTVDVTGAGTGRGIVTGTGAGAAPHVVVFDYATLAVTASFYAYATSMTAGVYVAGGNLNQGTIADEIAVGSGGGVQATVNLFTPTGSQLNSLPVFSGFMGAAKVVITDYNGDGQADLAVGAGPGAQPSIDVYDGDTLAKIDAFFGYSANFTGGINFGA